ncbi:MAG TPA: hypothetical protein VNS49_16025, partial [Streptomyces sp.]|nr:hypothetical protein [Streptomyces sp.]
MRTPDMLPALGPDQDFPVPPFAKAVLANGLRVLAVRVPSVPLVEMRVRVPLPAVIGHSTSVQQVLARALLHRRVHGFPDAVVTAGHGAACLTISGSMAATALRRVLEAVTESLTSPRYDTGTCRAASRRLAAHSALVRAQPSTIAREALLRHVYGGAFHSTFVADEDTAPVTPEQLTGLHGEVVRPDGAALVLVGDLDPETAVRELPSALSAWHSPQGAGSGRPRSSASRQSASPPPAFAGRGVVFVPRHGAVQSQIML